MNSQITIVPTELGIEPFADDEAAILHALKRDHFCLSHGVGNMFSGPNDRAATASRRDHVARLIVEREPTWTPGTPFL